MKDLLEKLHAAVTTVNANVFGHVWENPMWQAHCHYLDMEEGHFEHIL
jgi:hypothetical protein